MIYLRSDLTAFNIVHDMSRVHNSNANGFQIVNSIHLLINNADKLDVQFYLGNVNELNISVVGSFVY